MSLSEERLREIEARAKSATDGPWGAHDFGHAGNEEPSSIVVHTGKFDHSDLCAFESETAVAWMPRWERQESENAEFIAHARTDVPDLLAEVKRLTAENARLREGIYDMRDTYWVDGRRPLWSDAEELLNPPTEGETHADA